MTGHPRRGDLFLINLDPVKGSEQGGVRPALVIQNDVGNEFSPVVIIAAISSQIKRLYDVHVLIAPPEGNLDKESIVLLNQIRTVDKSRLTRKLGSLSTATMKRVERALKISLGLRD
ncbi:MAG: type II toxin-antitoxin system PemK/MazF family toxin [Candidatus Xenobiia bacterium LiM19]